MIKQLLRLYIFSLPFTSAFATAGGKITLSLLIAVIMLFAVVTHIVVHKPTFTIPLQHYLLACIFFISCVCISYATNSLGNGKAANHMLAYITAIFLFFIVPLLYLFFFRDQLSLKILMHTLFITLLVSAVFTDFEFVLKNTTGIDINNYLPRAAVEEFDALALDKYFRARGFAEEPSHYACFIEAFAPFVLYYLFFSGLSSLKAYHKVLSVFIIYLSWIFTVSTAAFSMLPIAIFITLVLNIALVKKYKKKLLRYAILCVLGLLAFVLMVSIFFPVFDLVVLSSVDKLDSGSLDDRTERYNFFIDKFSSGNILNWINGYGPAGFHTLGYDDTRSINALYFNIIFETGIIGLFALLLICFISTGITINSPTKIRVFMQLALFTVLLHHFFMGNYWFPWLWFLLALNHFIFQKSSTLVEP